LSLDKVFFAHAESDLENKDGCAWILVDPMKVQKINMKNLGMPTKIEIEYVDVIINFPFFHIIGRKNVLFCLECKKINLGLILKCVNIQNKKFSCTFAWIK